MIKTVIAAIAVASLALPITACHSTPVQTTVGAVIDCAAAEEAIAAKGQSPVQLAVSIAEQIADAAVSAASGNVLGAIETLVEGLVVQYGEQYVACVLHEIDAGPAAGSGSAVATSAEAPSLLGQIIAKHGWKFTK